MAMRLLGIFLLTVTTIELGDLAYYVTTTIHRH